MTLVSLARIKDQTRSIARPCLTIHGADGRCLSANQDAIDAVETTRAVLYQTSMFDRCWRITDARGALIRTDQQIAAVALTTGVTQRGVQGLFHPGKRTFIYNDLVATPYHERAKRLVMVEWSPIVSP